MDENVERLRELVRDWWFESHLSAAPGEVSETHTDSLLALLSSVDAEATERAAKVCDDRVEWSHGSPYEPSCPRNSESQEAYDCARAIRSTLPTPAAQEAQKP